MYYKTVFRLTEDAKNEILNYYKGIWSNNFEHRLEFLPHQWLSSLPGIEISKFLSTFKLSPYYTGINVFLSNTTQNTYTNPHVDILHKSKLLPILTRFNTKCQGDDDIMYWWNDCKWGSDKLIKKNFTSYSGVNCESLAIPGESITDRYKFLGNPTLSISNVLTPSAFVNTEFAHSLYIPKGPRIVLSVGFNQTFHNILDKIHAAV